MRLIPLAVLFVPMLMVLPASLASAEDAGATEEYWCYGDKIALSYGNDSANVTWTVADSAGNVRWNEVGDSIELIAPEFNTLFVTQSVQTAQGTAVKTIKLNLMHFNDKRVMVNFSSEGEQLKTKKIDGSTVCKDGVFVSPPDPPEPPEESMIFGGWHVMKDGEEKEFDPGEPVTQSMDVFATWLKTYQITFISHGDYFGSTTLVEGNGLEFPAMSSEDGAKFEGWYMDQKCQTPYDPATALESNQVLYAKWSTPPEEKEPFSPLLLIPIGVLIAVFFASHIRGQKRLPRDSRNTKRYMTPKSK